MTDFLLELRCEEIPARMQAGARADLERLFRARMETAGVAVGEVTVWSTPRRLALIAQGLSDATEPVREELKGPRAAAPAQALEGFLRKTGLSRDQLNERDGVYYAVQEKPGRATRQVLAEAIPAIVRAFPWPKSMRWGAESIASESLRWVRPLSGIVAIFGEDLVECEVGGVQSGYATLGHRFHHPGEITIGGASDYREKLRACHVIVDHAEREALIRERAAALAADAGLALVEDEGLVAENAGLTEWPVPLLGRFDAEFLEVPPEVIRLTARTNQKYFVCTNPPRASLGEGDQPQAGRGVPSSSPAKQTPPPASPVPLPIGDGEELADAFVCTANIEAADGGEGIVAGNRKVLAARLADARFFWQQDRRKRLEEHAAGLARITFHEKLGTVADKVERVARLARWLVEEGVVKSSPSSLGEGDQPQAGGGVPSSSRKQTPPPASPVPLPIGDGEDSARLANLAEQAARLAKADLVTEMVGEFPELQGVMGGYYARAEGLPDEVADAIRDHYKPIGQGDEVPTAPVTVAVSLADKVDTIVGFFGAKEKPTGSRDPFALRRAALGIIQLVFANQLRFGVEDLVMIAGKGFVDARFYRDMPDNEYEAAKAWLAEFDIGRMSVFDVPEFFADRLKVQQREAGVRHDLIDAVFALGGEDDLVRLLARVRALQSFVAGDDGANLLVAYRRAANILKKEGWHGEPAHGVEGRIPRDAEEDPLAMVDDPDVAAAYRQRLEMLKENRLSYTPEPAENALIEALDSAEPLAGLAVEREDFAGAMSALASLRDPIDAFFDQVTVNDPDPAKRSARLALLARFRDAVHRVADFSRIEG